MLAVKVTIVGLAQPWHTQSAVLHRALAAVFLAKPETAWAYLDALYANADLFTDQNTDSLSADQVLEKAAMLAEKVTGIAHDGFLKLCKSPEVVNELKAHARYARQNSIHVTPSLLFNGVRVVDFSSSWSLEDWTNFLQNP